MTCFSNQYLSPAMPNSFISVFVARGTVENSKACAWHPNSCTLSRHCWCCCQPSATLLCTVIALVKTANSQLHPEKWNQGTWTSITVCLSRWVKLSHWSLFNLCSEIVVAPLHFIMTFVPFPRLLLFELIPFFPRGNVHPLSMPQSFVNCKVVLTRYGCQRLKQQVKQAWKIFFSLGLIYFVSRGVRLTIGHFKTKFRLWNRPQK